jgi:thioredoxin 1
MYGDLRFLPGKMQVSKQVTLTDENFEQKVLQNNKTVLVVFGTDWSGSNHILDPIMEKFAVAFESKILVGKINADKNKMVLSLYPTEKYPTLMLFINGRLAWKYTGLISLRSLWETVETVIEEERKHFGGRPGINYD